MPNESYILVVDDEDFMRKLISKILSSSGYKILRAENGTKALELFKQFAREIRLVTLDIRMPDLSGIDVYKRMAKLKPSVRVLLCSGFIGDIPPGTDFSQISKPFSVSEFKKKVKEVLTLTDEEIISRNGPFLYIDA